MPKLLALLYRMRLNEPKQAPFESNADQMVRLCNSYHRVPLPSSRWSSVSRLARPQVTVPSSAKMLLACMVGL
jgi:hypothetical protein